MDRKLRVYLDKNLIDPQYPLNPLLYHIDSQEGLESFEYSPLENCDFVIYPYLWNVFKEENIAKELAKRAKQYNKKLVIFWVTDHDEPLVIDNSLIFKTSLQKTHIKANERLLPALVSDFLNEGIDPTIKLQLRTKASTPVIGFCGNINQLTQKKRINQVFEKIRRNITEPFIVHPQLKKLFQYLPIKITKGPNRYVGRRIRRKVIHSFKKAKGLQTNFLIRQLYYNGYSESNPDLLAAKKSKAEFIQNMLESDYILCPRGMGNYSIRLYETLCAGRIPILINTNITLPFEDEIDWKNHCIWVEENEIENLPELILRFHNSISEEEFLERQIACRELWEERLSFTGYFKHFYKYFQ